MSGATGPAQGALTAQPLRRRTTVLTIVALLAQAGVVCLTFVMGLFFPGILWVVALIQAGAAIGLVAWGAPRPFGAVALLVPVVSAGATFGLLAAANTVAVACDDRVLDAFEQLTPPDGASLELFVGGETQDCMAEVRGPVSSAKVFAHYRKEFERQGWRIIRERGGLLWAERDGMDINLYPAEGRVYVVLE